MTEINVNVRIISDSTPNPEPAPPAFRYVGYRVFHKFEGGYDKNPLNMPNVIPPTNSVGLEMTREIQEMSFALMQHFNPAITESLWTKVHGSAIAFNNYNGFGDAGDLRANYILGRDLSKPLPKYDKAQRLCGGMFLRGEDRGDGYLYCVPGVHGIDAKSTPYDLQTIIDNNWYLFAVTLYQTADKVGNFPQGQGGVVAIPFIFDREIKFPIAYFDKWESGTLPDHLTFYKV